MKRFILVCAIVFAVASTIFTVRATRAATTTNTLFYVNAETLTVRDSPGGKVRGTLERWDRFNADRVEGAWAHGVGHDYHADGSVTYIGGWVLREYLCYC